MTIASKLLFRRSNGWLCFAFLILTCTPDRSDDPIPPATFADFLINLTLPEYLNLGVDGGFKEINSIGVRGVIVYRVDATHYLAYERNCSYHPNDACATVDVDASHLFMKDSCCGSSFSFANGQPTGGIAWRPLRRYSTQLNGSMLLVTDSY